MGFREIKAEELNGNTFEMIGKQWMLVTAKNSKGQVNTMTASWGGVGIMWGKPVAFIFIRPQRYTKEFVDDSNYVSLTFFEEKYRSMLKYMGTVSGRNEDKIKHESLTVAEYDGCPYFEEASVVFKARKLYAQDLDKDCIIDNEIIDKWYPNDDWHTMYVCEIEKMLVR